MLDHYKAYFKDLAVKSVDIKHSEDDKSFFYVADKYNPKAFDEALKNVSGERPIMLLERYISDTTSNGNNNRFYHPNGRFTIVCMAEIGNQASIENAQALSELIVLKLLAKMAEDLDPYGIITFGDQDQKVFYTEDKLPMDPVGPMHQKYWGTTVGFTWRCPLMVKHKTGDWQNQNQVINGD